MPSAAAERTTSPACRRCSRSWSATGRVAVGRRHRLDLAALSAAGAGGFAATHGTITGTVFFSDGESHAQNVNVIARRVDNAGGVNESRTIAGVQRLRAPVPHLQQQPDQQADALRLQRRHRQSRPTSASMRSRAARQLHDRGREHRSGNSRRLQPRRLNQIRCRARRRAPIGPIPVTAGATSSGNDLTLIGTDPALRPVRRTGPVSAGLRRCSRAWPRRRSSFARTPAAAAAGRRRRRSARASRPRP